MPRAIKIETLRNGVKVAPVDALTALTQSYEERISGLKSEESWERTMGRTERADYFKRERQALVKAKRSLESAITRVIDVEKRSNERFSFTVYGLRHDREEASA